jgi:hypothetical protein
MTTPYGVTITMDSATVSQLVANSFSLYGFKAVKTAQTGGAPLVWFQSTNYSTATSVTWQEQFQAYTSTSSITANLQINASNSNNISLGQTMNVAAGGLGTVVQGGTSGAISILNQTTTQYTCGISQTATDGSMNPLCAFPLFGGNMDVMAPIEKVLLMFSSAQINTGTVIEKAYSPGIFIDLTANNHVSVSYDINKGWSWGGASWAQQVTANADMAPLLIE